MTLHAAPQPPRVLDLPAALDRIELALRTPDPGALAGYAIRLRDGRLVALTSVTWEQLHDLVGVAS